MQLLCKLKDGRLENRWCPEYKLQDDVELAVCPALVDQTTGRVIDGSCVDLVGGRPVVSRARVTAMIEAEKSIELEEQAKRVKLIEAVNFIHSLKGKTLTLEDARMFCEAFIALSFNSEPPNALPEKQSPWWKRIFGL